MKILVVGDYIEDIYVFGTATRLCPEAPVPVVIPDSKRTSAGGAGLVVGQLRELGADVIHWYGSKSRKERTFCNGQLVLRVDQDSLLVGADHFPEPDKDLDAIVVSDYGKGAMLPIYAKRLIETAKPCFVDAKPHWPWYAGKNVTIFPNHQEASPVSELPAGTFQSYEFARVVNKLGKDGCRLNDAQYRDVTIPATVTEVVDTCGAGDVFMASFVYAMVCEKLTAIDSLKFANSLAGESCRHQGTWIVPKEFAQGVLDRLLVSAKSGPPVPGSVHDSTPTRQLPQTVTAQRLVELDSLKFYNPLANCSMGPIIFGADQSSHETAQTLPKSPLDPKPSSDVPIPAESDLLRSNRSLSEE